MTAAAPIVGIVIFLISVASTERTSARVFSLVAAGLLGAFVIRSVRSASIYEADGTIVIRRVLRTYRFPISAVEGFRVVQGKVGLYQRLHVSLQKTDGGELALTEFNSINSSGEQLREAVAALNRRVRLLAEIERETISVRK